jgi:hypothetical protein
MNVGLFQLFKAALVEPKKQAAVRMLGIGKIMQYIFVLIGLITALSFIELALGFGDVTSEMEGLLQYVEEIRWLLYPFAFVSLFVSTTLYHFIKISFFAWIGMGMVRLMKRKGEYRHLWRTTALAVTLPTLLSLAVSYITSGLLLPMLAASITVLYLYLAIRFYPKLPIAQKNRP